MSSNHQPHVHKPAWQGTDWKRAMDLAHSAPRCTARCKHSKLPCRGPAVRGWTVCRKHGARGGGPRGERNGSYRHGRRTIEYQERKRRERSQYLAFAAMLKSLG